ncbi:MAG: TlpA disulfide reductase family protein [Bacteroidales bacterium]|jgi:peroxiredoxin
MKKFFLTSLVAMTAFACSTDKATIKGIIEGTSKGDLVLKVLDINNQRVIDTIEIEDGKFDYGLKLKDKSPNFYYLYYNERNVASLIILPGDNIKLIADTLGTKILTEGSEETKLLTQIDGEAKKLRVRFDSLANVLDSAITQKDEAKRTSLNYELGSLYVKQKQNSIKHLYTNPNSITNIILLYQKFPNNLPIFADVRDVLLFKRVCDSLDKRYPGSTYVARLKEEVSYREKSDMFNAKILDASETGFPDIKLPDVKSRIRSLSELSGKVIILSFWSVADANQRMLNQDFLQLYDKYSNKGLEIFQVSVDTDKTAWARAVDEQMLPWVSVCDGMGSGSAAVTTYNVTKVPSLFVIDKSGTIVAKNVFNSELDKLLSRIVK